MKRILITTIVLTSAALAHEPDVILDSHDSPSPVTYSSGTWPDDTTVTNAFRGNSKYMSYATSSNTATFHTNLPSAGPWQVFIWHNMVGYSSTQNAVVTHAEGTTTVNYNQQMNSGQWVLLGTFMFAVDDEDPETSEEAMVKITGNNGRLSADAVRFSKATADVVLDAGGTAQTGVSFSNANDWTSVTSFLAGNQQNLRRSKVTGATVTFQPTLPAAGDYELSIWLPPGIAHDQPGTWLPANGVAVASFAVDVHARGGVVTTHTVTVPMLGRNEGRWVQIGTGPFRFDETVAGQQYPAKAVVKTNGDDTYVAADAVRWSKSGSPMTFVDEADGSPSVVWSGSWTAGGTQTGQTFYNYQNLPYFPSYQHTSFTSGSSSARSVTFTPSIESQGYYDVYLWYPVHQYYYYANPITRVEIRTGLGTVVRSVNQRYESGKWTHVGRYVLRASSENDPPWVKVMTPEIPPNPTSYWWSTNSGNILADGVMFLRDNENKDTDGDGLPDWQEQLLESDPAEWDTDDDNIGDGDEYRLGLDLLTAISTETTQEEVVFTVYTPLTAP